MSKDTVILIGAGSGKANSAVHLLNVNSSESVKKTQSGLEEMLDLKCDTCGIAYQKPAKYKAWAEDTRDVFYRWSMTYCDKCRNEKQEKALARLPEIMKAIESRSNIVEKLKKLKKSDRPKL